MKRIALVLAGGAARGAYEVGVVSYVLTEVSRAIGRDVPLDILCGTSVGALNVAALAAFADEPQGRAHRLMEVWRALRVGDLVKSDLRGLLAGSRALLDTTGLEKLVADKIPFPRIGENLARGLLRAVTISTTHVASGKTVVFVQRAESGLVPWGHEPTIEPRAAVLTEHHALASSAIPILFRPVLIDGQYHCDGGLRQNVPLSPARRLGADGLLIVNPRQIRESSQDAPDAEEPRPGPLLLFGKALNSLLLDRLDTDLSRLEGINRLLAAGTHRYGPGFVDEINADLGRTGDKPKIRPLTTLLVRASEDIGKMSVDFVRSPRFQGRVSGPLARVMRRLAEAGGDSESDLLSYVLFDGEFAGELIEMGQRDAAARHEELCSFFETMWARDSKA